MIGTDCGPLYLILEHLRDWPVLFLKGQRSVQYLDSRTVTLSFAVAEVVIAQKCNHLTMVVAINLAGGKTIALIKGMTYAVTCEASPRQTATLAARQSVRQSCEAYPLALHLLS